MAETTSGKTIKDRVVVKISGSIVNNINMALNGIVILNTIVYIVVNKKVLALSKIRMDHIINYRISI